MILAGFILFLVLFIIVTSNQTIKTNIFLFFSGMFSVVFINWTCTLSRSVSYITVIVLVILKMVY